MVFVWNPTWPRKAKQPFQFSPVCEWFSHEILLDNRNRSNLSILTRFWMVFVWNPTRAQKSKQPFQLVLECFLHEILLDNGNRSKLINFDLFFNGFCMKSYQTTQIEATFSILTHFWYVFVWNSTRPEKSKQLVKIWPVFQWFLYEILLDHANRKKNFTILTRFWMVFV